MLTFFARRATLRRFSGTPSLRRSFIRRQKAHISPHDDCADFLDAVARATRNRFATTDAISYAVHCVPRVAPFFSPTVVSLVDGDPLAGGARLLPQGAARPYVDTLHTIVAASPGGSLVPTALERASMLLRDEARALEDIDSHTAHIQLSMRILTWLPLVILGLSLLMSRNARLALATSSGLFMMVLIGVLLNLVGRAWIRRLRQLRDSTSHDDLSSLMSFLVTSLNAGFGMMESIDLHARITSCRASYEVVRTAASGRTLRESLNFLLQHCGERAKPLVDLIGASLIDGQPVTHTIDRLSRELIGERRRQRDSQIRSMPVKMAAPLVATVLPSFILLAAVPLAGYTHLVIGSSPLT